MNNHQSQVTTPPSLRRGGGGEATYGLLGYPLGHSFSRAFFNEKFAREGIDAEYLNFELPAIDELPAILAAHPTLRGLNVTIPYKQAVIPYLDALSPEARAIGAVNVIRIEQRRPLSDSPRGGEDWPLSASPRGGEDWPSSQEDASGNEALPPTGGAGRGATPYLKGFNSDIIGFMDSIRPLLQPHHRRALVLGTGGASRAVCLGLEKLGLSWRYVSRSGFTPPPSSPAACSVHGETAVPASKRSLSAACSVLGETAVPASKRSLSAACSVLGDCVAESPLPYSALTPALLADYTVIVNCTPLGMFPKVDACPDIPYDALTPRHLLYDLVYNPEETLFLKRGREHGATVKNGLEMLHLQALASWRFWEGADS